MNILASLKISVLAGAAIVASSVTVASAQPVSLDDVLRAARAERAAAAEQNQIREAEFLRERNRQRERLNAIVGQVNAEDRRADDLADQFEANDIRIGELTETLQTRQGEFGELFGAARASADALALQLDSSIISSQYPGRSTDLYETAQATTLPTLEELQNIYDTYMQEMVAQSKTATYSATVALTDGTQSSATVTRVGPFVAFSDGDYYTMGRPEDSVDPNIATRPRLQELGRQPSTNNAVSNARNVEGFSGAGYTTATIDPSLGTLLGLIVESPNVVERFKQGKEVGYVIAIIFLIGVLIGVFKLFTLTATNAAVKGQVRRKNKPSRSNPLGRVMMAYESNTSADVETISLKLDDAVLKELPRLEGGLNLIKVFAAIAPLLGLLGTVVGMIVTFQQITLFGTGDPQIMAGGISQALVTTVLGLIAAIPLLLLHAFASGTSKSISQTLEEQAAGMIAEHAESRD